MFNLRNQSMPKLDTPEKTQKQRFIAKARELGCDENEKAFDAALKKIVAAKPTDRKGKAQKT